MKKRNPSLSDAKSVNRVQEPLGNYYIPLAKGPAVSKLPITRDFLFTDFKKVSDKAPFTVADWADMLHISERTLHRYAKENTAFNGMQIERILHLEKLIDMGNSLFGKEGFKNWLHFKPLSLQYQTPKELLTSHQGIQEVIDVIGRMQHGIPA